MRFLLSGTDLGITRHFYIARQPRCGWSNTIGSFGARWHNKVGSFLKKITLLQLFQSPLSQPIIIYAKICSSIAHSLEWFIPAAFNLGWHSPSSTQSVMAKPQWQLIWDGLSPAAFNLGWQSPSSTQSGMAYPQQHLIWDGRALVVHNLGWHNSSSTQSGMAKPQ